MDFVIFCNLNLPPSSDLTRLTSLSLHGQTALHTTQQRNTHIITSHLPCQENDGIVLFDGSAIGANAYANDFVGLDQESLQSIRREYHQISGSFCLVEISNEGVVSGKVDAMSQYMLYYYYKDSKFILSNNIFWVEFIALASGLEVRRSVTPFLSSYTMGAPHRLGSSISNVNILEAEQSLTYDGKLLTINASNFRSLTNSYDQAIEAAAAIVDRNVKKIASIGSTGVYFDVTGGMDSRIIFAALLKNGLHREFSYRCIRKFPHVDGHYAAMLAEKYKLRRKIYQNQECNQKIEFLDSERAYFEAFIGGGLGPRTGHIGSICVPSDIHIHGGFGEFGGASPDVKRCIDGNAKTVEDLVYNYNKRTQLRKKDLLLTKLAKEMFLDMSKTIINYYASVHSQPNAPLWLYNYGKSRSHFGFLSWLRGRYEQHPDVLHTRYLAEAAQYLTPHEQAAGKVNFDVIDRLAGPEALSLPLADKPWSDLADPGNRAGRDVIKSNSAPRFEVEEPMSLRPNAAIERVDPRGRSIKREYRAMFYYQEIMRDALYHFSPIFDIFNADAMRDLVTKAPNELTEVQAGALMTASAAVIWAGRLERPLSFSAPIPIPVK